MLVMILSGYVAAPAIASILLVKTARRWPLLQRSIIAAGVAATVMTFVAGGVWIGAVVGFAEDYSQHKMLYRILPYLALGTVAVAVWFQYRHRETVSHARAVGIACVVLLPIILFLAERIGLI